MRRVFEFLWRFSKFMKFLVIFKSEFGMINIVNRLLEEVMIMLIIVLI